LSPLVWLFDLFAIPTFYFILILFDLGGLPGLAEFSNRTPYSGACWPTLLRRRFFLSFYSRACASPFFLLSDFAAPWYSYVKSRGGKLCLSFPPFQRLFKTLPPAHVTLHVPLAPNWAPWRFSSAFMMIEERPLLRQKVRPPRRYNSL